MPIEIAELLDHGPWPRFAKLVTVLCALAIIFDGFDISIVGFAIPSMIRDLRLPRASFAPLLVIGFVGMIIGFAFGGILAERLVRRAALFWSVLVLGVAILLISFAPKLLVIEAPPLNAACGII